MTLSPSQKALNLWARLVQKPTLAMTFHQPTLNLIFSATSFTARPLPGTRMEKTSRGSIKTRVITPPNAGDSLLIYLHGGGFCIGSSFSHRWLAAYLGDACGAQVWVPDYRLAPRHPYPAAIEDCVAVYRTALDHFEPDRIVVAGDSAGGTLTLNLITRIHAAGLPQPAAIGLLSPAADFSEGNPGWGQHDMLLPHAWLQRVRRAYQAGHDPADPDLSPWFADLSMAPPAFIQAVRQELLFHDARRLSEKLPDAVLDVWDNLPHVWQINAGRSPEATDAITRMGAFLRERLA